MVWMCDLEKPVRRFLRESIIQMVLGTDMAHHIKVNVALFTSPNVI